MSQTRLNFEGVTRHAPATNTVTWDTWVAKKDGKEKPVQTYSGKVLTGVLDWDDVHSYFVENEDGTLICVCCYANVSKQRQGKGPLSNARAHLVRQHPGICAMHKHQLEGMRKRRITGIAKEAKMDARSLLAKFLITTQASFRIVENPFFQKLVAGALDKVPGRTTVGEDIRKEYNLVVEIMRNIFVNGNVSVAISFDPWSVNHKDFCIIVAHFIMDFNFITLTLAVLPLLNKSHTALLIAVSTKAVLERYGIATNPNVKAVAFENFQTVTGNAEGDVSAIEEVASPEGDIPTGSHLVGGISDNAANLNLSADIVGGDPVNHERCAQHSLALVVKKLFSVEKLDQQVKGSIDDEPAHDALTRLWRLLKNCRQLGAYLKKPLQYGVIKKYAAERGVEWRAIPLGNATRWNSDLRMVSAILAQKVVVEAYLANADMSVKKAGISFNEDDFAFLGDVCSILQLFEIATTMLSYSDRPTGPVVVPLYCVILTYLCGFGKESGEISDDAVLLRDHVRARLYDLLCSTVNKDSTALYAMACDPRFSDFTVLNCALCEYQKAVGKDSSIVCLDKREYIREAIVEKTVSRFAVSNEIDGKTCDGSDTDAEDEDAQGPSWVMDDDDDDNGAVDVVDLTSTPESEYKRAFKMFRKESKEAAGNVHEKLKSVYGNLAKGILSPEESDFLIAAFSLNPLPIFKDVYTQASNDKVRNVVDVVLDYYAIPGSSVSAEQAASVCGLVSQDSHRNRMSEDRIHEIVVTRSFLRFCEGNDSFKYAERNLTSSSSSSSSAALSSAVSSSAARASSKEQKPHRHVDFGKISDISEKAHAACVKVLDAKAAEEKSKNALKVLSPFLPEWVLARGVRKWAAHPNGNPVLQLKDSGKIWWVGQPVTYCFSPAGSRVHGVHGFISGFSFKTIKVWLPPTVAVRNPDGKGSNFNAQLDEPTEYDCSPQYRYLLLSGHLLNGKVDVGPGTNKMSCNLVVARWKNEYATRLKEHTAVTLEVITKWEKEHEPKKRKAGEEPSARTNKHDGCITPHSQSKQHTLSCMNLHHALS